MTNNYWNGFFQFTNKQENAKENYEKPFHRLEIYQSMIITRIGECGGINSDRFLKNM